MSGLDLRAFVDVELLLMAQAQQAEQARAVDVREQQWRNFLSVAPEPVIGYVLALDEDIVADRQAFDADTTRWMHQHHPLFDDVLEGLDRAVRARADNRLAYTQGWLLKHSWSHLEYWYALERQREGLTGGIHINDLVGAMAAEALLGWTVAEAHTGWLEPLHFLERWRVAGTSDPETLERAGLHRQELALLAA